VFVVLVVLALCAVVLVSPWPLPVTLRHLAAVRNCSDASGLGLAPARRGEPGYWSRHDRDDDGIACEAWPKRDQ